MELRIIEPEKRLADATRGRAKVLFYLAEEAGIRV